MCDVYGMCVLCMCVLRGVVQAVCNSRGGIASTSACAASCRDHAKSVTTPDHARSRQVTSDHHARSRGAYVDVLAAAGARGFARLGHLADAVFHGAVGAREPGIGAVLGEEEPGIEM